MADVSETLDANPIPGSSDRREDLRTNDSNGKDQTSTMAPSNIFAFAFSVTPFFKVFRYSFLE